MVVNCCNPSVGEEETVGSQFSSHQSTHLANSRPVRDPVSRKRKGERHWRKGTKVILQPLHTCANALMNTHTLTVHSWIHIHMENMMSTTHSSAGWPALCGHLHCSPLALEDVLLSLPPPPTPKQVFSSQSILW